MRTKATHAAGSSKVLKKGAVSTSSMKNGEEILQYHNGKLKVIRKEFGKLFEMEYKRADHRELETFAKFSDIKRPQREAIKVIKEGVRIANDGTKKLYTTLPDTSDSQAAGGEAVVDSGNIIPK
tara:strand:+ start:2250 stop:2621 length:372 start_codon:yes stop_codon:yes gene_type:complete